MLYIGKASKFYTLWEVNSDTRTDYAGREYKVVHHTYLKNISIDFTKAQMLYPDAPFDSTLCGHTSFDTSDYARYNDDEFKGGKYAGQKIASCTDYGYIFWATERCPYIFNCNFDLVASILEPRGYRRDGERFYSPDEIERAETDNAVAEDVEVRFGTDGYLDVEMSRNLNDYGEYRVADSVLLTFNDWAEMEYNGFRYGLPVANGKAKRVKGKTLRVYGKVSSEVIGLSHRINICVERFDIR